jgi:hypothetical protein
MTQGMVDPVTIQFFFVRRWQVAYTTTFDFGVTICLFACNRTGPSSRALLKESVARGNKDSVTFGPIFPRLDCGHCMRAVLHP